MHAATYEGMAKENGEVSDALIKRYAKLAKGGIGLIITGFMYVHPTGRGYPHQTGIHSDDMVPGLKQLTDRVHQEGGKIAFQLAHAGRQTTRDLIGQTPLGPSAIGRDPVYFVKPKKMTAEEILEMITAFGTAASRAVAAGADGIQLHGAHGWLINEFLSPFFNSRTDSWGGTDTNRFRFLKEIILETQKALPDGMPVLVKLSTNDYTPKQGITPPLSVKYAESLAELGIEGVEVSCGTGNYSYMNMRWGDVPTNEFLKALPWWQRPLGRLMIGKLEGKYDLEEGYNLEDAKMDKVSCVSCNRCLAAVPNDIPIYCHNKGFPK